MKRNLYILVLFSVSFASAIIKVQAQQKLFAGRVNNVSSVYDIYPYGWSTYQILGAPNVYPAYGDIEEAFNPENFGVQRDFIDLEFDNNGPIDSIFIYETYTPGFVDSVFVKNPGTSLWDLVYSAVAAPGAAVSNILAIGFPMTTYDVKEVRLTLANDTAPDWVEIDAVAISPATTTPFTPETVPGTSYAFDGVSDAYHTYSSLLNLISDSAATFTAWINIQDTIAPSGANVYDGSAVLCDADGTYLGIYHANVGGSDSLYFYNYDGADNYFGMDYTLNTWFHIAWVHSGGYLRAYKNGVLYRTIASDVTTNIFVRPLEMGFNLASGNYFQGEIDEVTSFNRGLSATEVYNVMRMNVPGNMLGMTGYWQMSNCDEQHFFNPQNHIADSLDGVSCNFSGVPDYTETEIIAYEKESMVIFPNPSSGIVNLLLKNIQPTFLAVYDLTGRVIYQTTDPGNDLITLSTENWPDGIYSVQLVDINHKTHISKLIKQ